MFALSQINWSTLFKEVYVIMMSFHKMESYLHNAEVVIWSDHAALQKLITNKTKNVKNVLTQNLALEFFSISPYISFQYLKGKDNILVDSLSCLQCLGLYKNPPRKTQCGVWYYDI